MEEELKHGDIVILKSGGPQMTLDQCASGVAKCVYFRDTNDCVQYCTVSITSLKKFG